MRLTPLNPLKQTLILGPDSESKRSGRTLKANTMEYRKIYVGECCVCFWRVCLTVPALHYTPFSHQVLCAAGNLPQAISERDLEVRSLW